MSSARSTATAPRDYDTARQDTDSPVGSLEELQERRSDRVDDLGDPAFIDDGFLLPTADLAVPDDDELTMPVVPMQASEFRCSRCFLVLARYMTAPGGNGTCRDCA